jgi:protein SCO1/2
LVFVCSVGALIMMKVRGSAPAAAPAVIVQDGGKSTDPLLPDPRTSGLAIPPFSLVNQDGRPVTRDVLLGHVTIIDFFFTNCPFICPMLTAQMSSLADSLARTGVRFISITVDPAHDTPERLKEYGAVHGVDFTRWSFLTGSREEIWALLAEKGGLKSGIEEQAEQPIMLPDGTRMSNIRHPGWFVLAGPKGEVLGIYKADQPEDMENLEARARAGDRRLAPGSK